MSEPLYVSREEAQQLREKHYNATLTSITKIHEDLWLFRVRSDSTIGDFQPGQYTSLGLGYWEPRLPGTQAEEVKESLHRKLVRRAYSIGCAMLDDQDHLVRCADGEALEFYIVLVRENAEAAPGLTPRLFTLGEGDRLWMGTKITGHYTLAGVRPDDNVLFLSTGTGEAPHDAMLVELLAGGHRGRLVSLVCVRQFQDLGYRRTHERIAELYPQYACRWLTTREPINLDPQSPGYVGKIYLQQYIESGDFEREYDIPLDPERTHVFLCGNPDMIGAPLKGRHVKSDTEPTFPEKRGMCQMLYERGFIFDAKDAPGTIHYEEYW